MQAIRTATRSCFVDPPGALAEFLKQKFSYKIEGAWFSPAYKAHVWDGKIRLATTRKDGSLWFPSGLWTTALNAAEARGVAVETHDERPEPVAMGTRPTWIGPALRPYQEAAWRALHGAEGGILKMATRGGKTAISARLIQELGWRTLFVVPSKLLLDQAIKMLVECLSGASVTSVGAGEWDDSGDVVVATIQSLDKYSSTREFRRFARQFGLLVLDEIHHFKGSSTSWRKTALSIEARRKYGLSATIGSSRQARNESEFVWLRGICGPIVYALGTSDLIEAGFLVRPTIQFVRYETPYVEGSSWSPIQYGKLVVNCDARNGRIIEEAIRYAQLGKRVLIDVSRVEHAAVLSSLFESVAPKDLREGCQVLIGATKELHRQRAIQHFKAGRKPVLISTVMGEGVDVPELEVVINAEGGKAHTSTMQRFRNLTLSEGKRQAILIELVDLHHARLKQWTLERLQVYRTEASFKIQVEKPVDKGARSGLR